VGLDTKSLVIGLAVGYLVLPALLGIVASKRAAK
jgi:hypothetical protein